MDQHDLPDKTHKEDGPPLSPSNKNRVVNLVRQDFAGPLPHPSTLEGYEHVLPGSAERILIIAEKQLDHRINTESLLAREQLKQSGRGQHYALFICSFALAISAALALTGHEFTASVIGGLDLIGLAAVFIAGKAFEAKEKTDESDDNN
jgi:uncharacterized membrane protein